MAVRVGDKRERDGKDQLELSDFDRDNGETVDLSEKMKSNKNEHHGLLKVHQFRCR